MVKVAHKSVINRVASFLHITDSAGQLDIVDLSFMAVVLKILLSHGVDYPSLVSLVSVIMAKMHSDHLETKTSLASLNTFNFPASASVSVGVSDPAKPDGYQE